MDTTKSSIQLLDVVPVKALAILQKLEIQLDEFACLYGLAGAFFTKLMAKVSTSSSKRIRAWKPTLLSCLRRRTFRRLCAFQRRISTSPARADMKSLARACAAAVRYLCRGRCERMLIFVCKRLPTHCCSTRKTWSRAESAACSVCVNSWSRAIALLRNV